MAVELWETLKDSITAYTGLAPTTFFRGTAASATTSSTWRDFWRGVEAV